jgi:hypothetical protein
MLDHKAKISEDILKVKSEGTIDIHEVCLEHLSPVASNESLDKIDILSK